MACALTIRVDTGPVVSQTLTDQVTQRTYLKYEVHHSTTNAKDSAGVMYRVKVGLLEVGH